RSRTLWPARAHTQRGRERERESTLFALFVIRIHIWVEQRASRCQRKSIISSPCLGGGSPYLVKAADGHLVADESSEVLINKKNGLLGGFVVITSRCPVWNCGRPLCAGSSRRELLLGLNEAALRMRYDDPLEAAQLHGCCGTWGLLFTGLFAKEELVVQVGVRRPFGVLMEGGWELLAA
ncbi:hypothetical protein Taro_025850, partial [Colocasia esculenta]|nr:hypothetical protein [Colocasia esculenta]